MSINVGLYETVQHGTLEKVSSAHCSLYLPMKLLDLEYCKDSNGDTRKAIQDHVDDG